MDVAQLSHGDPALHSTSNGDSKRKRTPDEVSATGPPQKAAKTTNTLAINYLARQHTEDLPLISNDDALPSILRLLGDYQGVLERHESMACNLGARPLGPILIKRFERLFESPPKVLKNHGKEGNNISWLDVVEFARNKPEQFTLGQMSEGAPVCQFYTKQCRVQISEEDFVLISSGIPQKMIPPQPIVEDEEKELGTLEILEKNLSSICHLADQVAARTRQLRHRINGRKQAILERRATESEAFSGNPVSSHPHYACYRVFGICLSPCLRCQIWYYLVCCMQVTNRTGSLGFSLNARRSRYYWSNSPSRSINHILDSLQSIRDEASMVMAIR